MGFTRLIFPLCEKDLRFISFGAIWLHVRFILHYFQKIKPAANIERFF